MEKTAVHSFIKKINVLSTYFVPGTQDAMEKKINMAPAFMHLPDPQ